MRGLSCSDPGLLAPGGNASVDVSCRLAPGRRLLGLSLPPAPLCLLSLPLSASDTLEVTGKLQAPCKDKKSSSLQDPAAGPESPSPVSCLLALWPWRAPEPEP